MGKLKATLIQLLQNESTAAPQTTTTTTETTTNRDIKRHCQTKQTQERKETPATPGQQTNQGLSGTKVAGWRQPAGDSNAGPVIQRSPKITNRIVIQQSSPTTRLQYIWHSHKRTNNSRHDEVSPERGAIHSEEQATSKKKQQRD